MADKTDAETFEGESPPGSPEYDDHQGQSEPKIEDETKQEQQPLKSQREELNLCQSNNGVDQFTKEFQKKENADCRWARRDQRWQNEDEGPCYQLSQILFNEFLALQHSNHSQLNEYLLYQMNPQDFDQSDNTTKQKITNFLFLLKKKDIIINSVESLLNQDEFKAFKTIFDMLQTMIKKLSIKKPQNEFDNFQIIQRNQEQFLHITQQNEIQVTDNTEAGDLQEGTDNQAVPIQEKDASQVVINSYSDEILQINALNQIQNTANYLQIPVKKRLPLSIQHRIATGHQRSYSSEIKKWVTLRKKSNKNQQFMKKFKKQMIKKNKRSQMRRKQRTSLISLKNNLIPTMMRQQTYLIASSDNYIQANDSEDNLRYQKSHNQFQEQTSFNQDTHLRENIKESYVQKYKDESLGIPKDKIADPVQSSDQDEEEDKQPAEGNEPVEDISSFPQLQGEGPGDGREEEKEKVDQQQMESMKVPHRSSCRSQDENVDDDKNSSNKKKIQSKPDQKNMNPKDQRWQVMGDAQGQNISEEKNICDQLGQTVEQNSNLDDSDVPKGLVQNQHADEFLRRQCQKRVFQQLENERKSGLAIQESKEEVPNLHADQSQDQILHDKDKHGDQVGMQKILKKDSQELVESMLEVPASNRSSEQSYMSDAYDQVSLNSNKMQIFEDSDPKNQEITISLYRFLKRNRFSPIINFKNHHYHLHFVKWQPDSAWLQKWSLFFYPACRTERDLWPLFRLPSISDYYKTSDLLKQMQEPKDQIKSDGAAVSSSQRGDEEDGDGNEENNRKNDPIHGGSYLAAEEKMNQQGLLEAQIQAYRRMESGKHTLLSFSQKIPLLGGQEDPPLNDRGGERGGGRCKTCQDHDQLSKDSDSGSGSSSNSSRGDASSLIDENRPVLSKDPQIDNGDPSDRRRSQDNQPSGVQPMADFKEYTQQKDREGQQEELKEEFDLLKKQKLPPETDAIKEKSLQPLPLLNEAPNSELKLKDSLIPLQNLTNQHPSPLDVSLTQLLQPRQLQEEVKDDQGGGFKGSAFSSSDSQNQTMIATVKSAHAQDTIIEKPNFEP